MTDIDVIVFSQTELYNALNEKVTNIALCDNTFLIPSLPNRNYMAIGGVRIAIDVYDRLEAEKLNITIENADSIRYIGKKSAKTAKTAKTVRADSSSASGSSIGSLFMYTMRSGDRVSVRGYGLDLI